MGISEVEEVVKNANELGRYQIVEALGRIEVGTVQELGAEGTKVLEARASSPHLNIKPASALRRPLGFSFHFNLPPPCICNCSFRRPNLRQRLSCIHDIFCAIATMVKIERFEVEAVSSASPHLCV